MVTAINVAIDRLLFSDALVEFPGIFNVRFRQQLPFHAPNPTGSNQPED